MGSMVDVRFQCSMDPKYAETWSKGYQSNEDGIAKVKAQYEEQCRVLPECPGEVTVNRRDDIGMIEVLYDRGRKGYWPAVLGSLPTGRSMAS